MLFTKVKYKGVALELPYISPVWCVESVVWNICLLSRVFVLLAGRASAWQDHLSLTASGPTAAAGGAAAGGVVGGGGGVGGGGAVGSVGGGEGGLAGDVLGSRAVARVFEGRLAEALLADDGSLSLATLAGNTLGSLFPKLETQGQLG